MKRILLLILTITTAFTLSAFAQDNNQFGIYGSPLQTLNGNNLRASIFTYRDDGANIFLPSELNLTTATTTKTSSIEDYNLINFSFFKELSIGRGENYIGFGIKALNKKEENAATKGYALPLSFKTIQPLHDKIDFNGDISIFPIGNYDVNTENIEFGGKFSGYKLNLGLKGQLTDTFSIKGGYLREGYYYGDDQSQQIAGYNEALHGLYFGAEITF
ncbi:hypothetical protein BX659_10281 [Orenia metallireducens]|jgi:hypothetical protein|uniref:Outer membrane protein beta-barrel domain-containing protein n=1 Tax=Orenia metallireducens TaxID=1413210 RepID=A0A285F5Q9_9FIRM|nr:hypothetical protein [Orenia metallireducens]PRX34766.1 hypothetical protein BX659_10281 [Orenia metallireducens]SNY05541.1 hypothetical protein SAMN06265827_10181 [Orenia metallireducens]